MQEILIAKIGLVADATDEQILTAIDLLIEKAKNADAFEANINVLKNVIDESNIELEEANEKIANLEKDIEALREQVMCKTDSARKANDSVTEPLKQGKALDEEMLLNLAKSVLKANEHADKVYVTQDGACFIHLAVAANHRRAIGGRMLTIYREPNE